jgi:hypothetical protein
MRTPLLSGLLKWQGRELYLGELWVGEIMQWSAGPRAGQWRAWVTTEPPGAHHGWYETESEARSQVEAVVRRSLPVRPVPAQPESEPR